MATKFEVMVNGKKFRRTSMNKVYTHAIVGRWDYVTAANRAASSTPMYTDENYKFHVSIIDGTYYEGKPYTYTQEEKAKDAKRSRAEIGTMSLTEYRMASLLEAMLHVEQMYGKGEFRTGVFAWSQSLPNAMKAIGKFRNRNYRDLQAIPVGANITVPPQPRHAFVAVTRDGSFSVGRADEGTKGYTQTMASFPSWADAQAFATSLNEAAGLSEREATEIVAGTVRKD